MLMDVVPRLNGFASKNRHEGIMLHHIDGNLSILISVRKQLIRLSFLYRDFIVSSRWLIIIYNSIYINA